MYRRLKISIWDDPRIQQLSTEAKLVYFYLYTSNTTTPAGTHRLNPRVIDAELGTGDAVSDIAELEANGLVMVISNSIFIPSFHGEQRQSPYFTIAALKYLKTEDEDVKKEFVRLYSHEISQALSSAKLRKWEEDYLSEFAEMIMHVQAEPGMHSGIGILKERLPDVPEGSNSVVRRQFEHWLKWWNFDPNATTISGFYKFDSFYETVVDTVSNTVSDTVLNTTDIQIQIQIQNTDTAAAAAENSREVFHNLSTSFPHCSNDTELEDEVLPENRLEPSPETRNEAESNHNRSP